MRSTVSSVLSLLLFDSGRSTSCSAYEIATWMLVFTCVLLILAFFMLLAVFGRTQRKLSSEQAIFSMPTAQPPQDYVRRYVQWCQIENQQSPVYAVDSHFSRRPDGC